MKKERTQQTISKTPIQEKAVMGKSKTTNNLKNESDGSSSSEYKTIPAASRSNSSASSMVIHDQSETERLREQNTLQKFQMRNACKNLLKVDEFLGNLANKQPGKELN